MMTGPAATTRKAAGPLTTRQSQVVHLAVWGYPNKAIAEILGIAAKTVVKHRMQAYKILGPGCDCIQKVIIIMRYKHGVDLLAYPPPFGDTSDKRVILKADHPFAGQCGTLIGMATAPNGTVHPKVRLDTGDECLVSSISQIQ